VKDRRHHGDDPERPQARRADLDLVADGGGSLDAPPGGMTLLESVPGAHPGGRAQDAPVPGKTTQVLAHALGPPRAARPAIPGRTTLVEQRAWDAEGREPDDAVAPLQAQVRAAVQSLGGSGRALAPHLQTDYGARLGVDLGPVRVHVDSTAARELGALAFTHGASIAIAPGVDLDSAHGGHVLAHELVHVAQNVLAGSGSMAMAAHMELGPSDSPVEREAEAGAAALRAGLGFRVEARGTLPAISRFTPAHAPLHGPTPSPTPTPGPTPSRTPSRSPGPASPAAPVSDQAVRAELERRADPAARAAYDHSCAQIDVLRIQALQFTFSPTGFGSMILQSVWPWQTVKDHALGISSTNPYPPGSLERYIEMVRGVIRVLGDVVSWLGTIADIVAMASGLLALITSETVIGGVTFGAIAAAAAEAGTAAGLIKIVLDLLDAILGFVEILILCQKIRDSKNPDDRAVLAAELGRECQNLASTLTTIVVEGATIVVSIGLAAGVNAAVARSLKSLGKNLRDELAGELSPLLHPKESLKTMTAPFKVEPPPPKLPTRETTDPGAVTAEEMEAGAVVMRRTAIRRELVKSRLSKAKRKQLNTPKQWREYVVGTTERPILRPKDIPKVPKGDKGTRFEQVYVIDPNKLRKAPEPPEPHEPGDVRSDAVGLSLGLLSGGAQGGGENGGPGTAGQPTLQSSSLTHVAMWPSMLDKLSRTTAPLGATNDHVMEQYQIAKSQLGATPASKVEAALGATKNSAGQLRFKSVQQEADAAAGITNAQKGSAAAQAGKDKNDQARSNTSTINGSIAKLGGTPVPRPKPEEGGNIFQRAEHWVYNHTIGELANLTGKLQGWITKTVGQWAMSYAGLTKDELDMAGIDDSMRSDALKDHKTQADMQQAQDDAQKIDPAVAQLMAGMSKDEQDAIQAMVDAQEIMTTIDGAQAALQQTITAGNAYVAHMAPIIRHELETQRAHQTIDARYIAPGIKAATDFRAAARGAEPGAADPANTAKAELRAGKTEWAELDIAPGEAQVDAALRRFNQRHTTATGRAEAACQRAIGSMQALIGTTNYAGVTAALGALDAAMSQFDSDEEGAASAYAADLDSIVEGYQALVKQATTLESIPVPDDGAPPRAN
jgi:hypothetical protein